ncbi:cobyrinate a,c-diamide synthase [Dyadobacter sp. CY347]|uniref:cobyrinate a,c-diamide synthase n=1 Tax=Dyadobacter sp. CY347 TaxID=2909336 RepID=UPI001F3EF552|nr:cobyrinate a,c-diamide synthase [Dyadobacter sp. CY347]MCF2487546.1 cobyrinate a,c-diamide synthase [Dyadobacter sp. CY347]
MKSHFLISAPSSNSGKTTVTLGLLRALSKRGLKVQPFKCGPDYIDPLHHTHASGNVSINLDTFMASKSHVQEQYQSYSQAADVSVTEGVMGLFDGAHKMKGSSAEIAELLHIPVILVMDARSMAYSVAPLLFGLKNFRKEINVAGVIFNFVNTASHYSFLKDACADVGIEPLGYLPKNEELKIPSRHLGLHISEETDYEAIIENAACAIAESVDLDRLLEITKADKQEAVSKPIFLPKQNQKIAIARDEAFAFTYHQNIRVLSSLGQIEWFSPLHDSVMPTADFLYLPGGYPELYADELSQNHSMRQSIQDYCENGGLTYAECGGLMYLGENLTNSQGEKFAMADVLKCSTTMQNTKMTLGYRTAQWADLEYKGHEFHYSDFETNDLGNLPIQCRNAKGIETDTKLYRHKNTFASYMHVYWGENGNFIKKLLKLSANS